jgi:hypothetical protein
MMNQEGIVASQARGKFLEFCHVPSKMKCRDFAREPTPSVNQLTNDDCERLAEGDCLPGKFGYNVSFRVSTDELPEWGWGIHSTVSQTLLSLL